MTASQPSPLMSVPVSLVDLPDRLQLALRRGGRLGLLTARRTPGKMGFTLVTLILFPFDHKFEVWETSLGSSERRYPSLTQHVSQAHWFERAIYDFFGLKPERHPRCKSVILHGAWPEGFHPLREASATIPDNAPARSDYKFLTVRGEGVYEIPVGPIHAGIIEPGHFRFSCLGEVIQNLEIRLGYQHRGVEQQLTQIPWRRARFLAEGASSDTSAGNAWAHAMAIEQILGINPPPFAQLLRALALEIERIASHLGDLGGICSDIGFAAGAATFSILRGRALGLGERLTGSRFLTAYIVPGGVAHDLPAHLHTETQKEVKELAARFEDAAPLLLDNSGALERMEGAGKVRPSLARDFGLVGPAGRANGLEYDVRKAFTEGPYLSRTWQVATGDKGDVLARVQIRIEETRTSLDLIGSFLVEIESTSQQDNRITLPDALPPNSIGVGIVEAWRGELIHLVITDGAGGITRYSIKDPSFNNWTGLAIAARGELVADFPLCNKSFGLSYCGSDL